MVVKKKFGNKKSKGTGKSYKNLLVGKTIDYKDIELLNNFISDRGKIRSRELTGISVKQQREIARAIKNAREMALMPFVVMTKKVRGGGRNER